MRICSIAISLLCLTTLLFASPNESSEKSKLRPIRSGDIYRATSVFLQRNQSEEFAVQIMEPVYRASEIVMIRQMPEANKLAAEIAQSLSMIEDTVPQLGYIAARAFMHRPDLFHGSLATLNDDDRAKSIAKIYVGWVAVKSDLESNPQTSTSTRVRISAFDNILNAWKNRYPKYLPQRYKPGA
ncbi:MAG: hypothetical protein ACOY3I_03470 [Verrucomicrobiota bacterium]